MRRKRIATAAVVLGTTTLLLGATGLSGAAGSSTGCPDGTQKLAKFDNHSGTYVAEGASPVVMLDAGNTTASWTSRVPVAAVVVKGGSGELSLKLYRYEPPVVGGQVDNSGLLNHGGNVPDISHVEFCGPEEASTTTTTGPTTTTTGPTTTTTGPTTTTTGPTTTTTGLTAQSIVTVDTSAPSTVPTTSGPIQVLGEVLARDELPRTGGAALSFTLGVGLIIGGGVLWVSARRQRDPDDPVRI